jgi:AmmeMemoRadiSam system protein A
MTSSFDPHTISDEGRVFLLRLARDAITARLHGLSPPATRPEEPVLCEHRGAFVTLKKRGRLRGCIGYIAGVSELWLAVRENAESAAFNDPRFPPVQGGEMPEIQIEISALTPLVPSLPEDVVVGRDGVVVERNGRRAVLLPQVAVEQGWDSETLLDATCRKAGLEFGCWREAGTTLETFSAEVFGER